jgi:hypothetical protein
MTPKVRVDEDENRVYVRDERRDETLELGRADAVAQVVKSNAGGSEDNALRLLSKVHLSRDEVEILRKKDADYPDEDDDRTWSSREAFFSGIANYCLREGAY